MEPASQQAGPQPDPHEAIAAQLRNQAPGGGGDPSELNITPVDRDAPAASPAPSIEPPLRAAPANDSTGESAPRAPRGRGVSRVLLVVCACIAAAVAWQSYGEEAKQRLSYLTPKLLADAPAPTQSTHATEPRDSVSQAAAPHSADAAPAPAAAASAIPSAPEQPAMAAETAPAQATLPPALEQSIDAMMREIASLKQTVDELKAGQQRLSRDLAKAAEQEARRKPATQASKPPLPPRPQRASPPPPHAAAAPRSPAPYPPPQTYPQGPAYPQGAEQREAYIPPPAPTRLPPEPGYSSVPRPPMPLQ